MISRILLCGTATIAFAAQQFDVASIKPAADPPSGQLAMAWARMMDSMPVGSIPMPDPGRVRMNNATLRRMIAAAYRVRNADVSGPAWMDDTWFDLEATMPAGAKADQAHEMLQALLVERFGLESHRETRQLSGFTLTVGKNGPKLQQAAPPAPVDDSLTPQERRDKMVADMQQRMRNAPRVAGGSNHRWNNTTTEQLVQHLFTIVGGPVVDATGLTGKYTVEIQLRPATDDAPEQTIFSELERLGLKLTPRKISAEFLVVDKVSRTPTAN
jgi:uncharacterized protein (TIGR03435 family)